jgi:hypothetical protein
MAKLPRSPIAAEVRNNYTPVREARASGADPVGGALERAGGAAFELGNRMAEAKIAVEGAKAETALQSRLDAEKRLLESATDIEPEELEARFRQRANQIVSEEAGRMTSPALRRAFAQVSGQKVESYSIQMRDVTRRKQVARIDSDLLSLADAFQKTTEDADSYFKDPTTGEPSVAEASLANAISAVQRSAGILEEDVVKARILKLQATYDTGLSNMHIKNIETRLEAGNFAAAESYFRENVKEIGKAEQDKVDQVIRLKTREGEAIIIGDELWDKANGDYNQYLSLLRQDSRVNTPDVLTSLEARGAQRLAQTNAAASAKQAADLDKGMSYVVAGGKPPASWYLTADPGAAYTVQERVRAREEQVARMATMSAEQRVLQSQISKGNYYRLKAQLAGSDASALTFEGLLADPAMAALYENMTPDEQGQFYNDFVSNKKDVGTNNVLKEYKNVIALAGAYLPEGMTDKGFRDKFKRLGEGDPADPRGNAGKTKSPAAVDLEGAILRLTEEELQRTRGAVITPERAKQIVALGYQEAGFGTAPEAVMVGNARADMEARILAARNEDPALWSRATAYNRSLNPNAGDDVIYDTFRELQDKRAARSQAPVFSQGDR